MTTVHHDPHAYGAALSSAEVNRPLAELDAAVELAMVSGSGWSTVLDGTAASGQKVIPVASTTNALPGMAVWVGTPGGTNEQRTIDTVSAGVSVTVTVNLTNTYLAGALISASPAEIVEARGGQSSLGARVGLIEGRVFDVRKYGAAGDGTTDDRGAITSAIAAAGVDGGTVYLPPGDYRVTMTPGQRYALQMPSWNVRLQGAGYGSAIELDPATVLAGGTIAQLIEIGGAALGVSNVSVSDLRLRPHHSTVGGPVGAWVAGIGARQDGAGAGVLEHCDHVSIIGNWIEDANIGVYACKNQGTAAGDANRLAAQHSDWIVARNYISTTANKAIELQEAMDSAILDNRCVAVTDGPQAIRFSRRIRIAGNRVDYDYTGVNVTEGCTDIDVEGNILHCATTGNGTGGIIIRREADATTTTLSRIRIAGNRVIDDGSATGRAFTIDGNAANTGGIYDAITIVGNTFVGKSYLYDRVNGANTSGTGVVIRDNAFIGDAYTSSAWSSAGTRVERNRFTTAHTANTAGWAYSDNLFAGGFTLASTAGSTGIAEMAYRTGGFYVTTPTQGAPGSSALTNQRLCAAPIRIEQATTIDRIGLEVTGAGSAGSVIRLGIYADAGGYPGILIHDAGTIDGTSATYQEKTIAFTLQPGVYWLAACAQGSPTPTNPSSRLHVGAAAPIGWSTAATISGALENGYIRDTVTGALPTPFTPTSVTASAPRVVVRVA